MLCQKCGLRDATVRMMRIVNGERETMFLCDQCAREEGNFDLMGGGGLYGFINSLLGGGQALGANRWAARLTEKARRALAYAEEAAKERGSAYIDTSHMLLGLFRTEDGLAARLLEEMQLDQDSLSAAIDETSDRGDTFRGFSPHAKRALQLAAEEARKMGLAFVDTEHLLLGLAAEEEGAASHWLKEQGDADADSIRRAIAQMQQQGREQDGEAEPRHAEENAASGAPAQRGGKRSKTPTLDKFGRDLTALAREDKLDPVIGRAAEIQRVIQILSRRTKNNPVLIGEPGVGKTAIADRKSTRLNSSHPTTSRMPSSA